MKKKLLALGLTLCMALSMSSAVFAAETTTSPVAEATTEVSEAAVARNIDYYTFPNQILDGYKTIRVTPGSGEALKMHVYLESGALTVWVKPAGSLFYSKKATWNTIGHHYVDLVSSTNGGSYDVRSFGAASWFEGGIYSGN